jgi:hypothetical protein
MSLIKEIKAGKTEKALQVLSSECVNVKEVDPATGRTPLHFCVEMENDVLLEKLVSPQLGLFLSELGIRDKFGDVFL